MKQLEAISKETFVRTYQSLPDDVRISLFSEETADKMAKIRQKHSVTDEQWPQIVRIVGRTMMAIFLVKDFVRNIVELIGIDQQEAAALAKDINQEIFQPVRESLMEVHGIANGESQIANSLEKIEGTRDPAPEQTASQPPVGLPQKPPIGTPPSQENTPKPDKPFDSSRELGASQAQGKPLSLEELEAREAEITETTDNKPGGVSQGMATDNAPASPKTASRGGHEAREGLIERLKKEREENPPSHKASEGRVADAPRSVDKKGEAPEATQAAWNGRTIDLTKIPPRRKSPNNNESGPTVHEV